MTEIEETAVQTFSLVPEIYQQIFIEKGVNFPDELVDAIKNDPAQASQLLERDKQLKNEVVNIFKENQNKIMQAAQSFKTGGKLDYLQWGGQAPSKYYNEKGWPVSAEIISKARPGRIIYEETPTARGNNNYLMNQLQKKVPDLYKLPVFKIEYNKAPVAHYILDEGTMANWPISGEDLVNYNNRKAQWNHPEDPRNIRKQQYGGEVNMLQNTASISNIGGPFGKAIGEATKNLNQITGGAAYQQNPSQNIMKPVSSEPKRYFFGNNAAKKYNQEMEKRMTVLNKLTTPKASQPTNNYLNSNPAIG